MIAMPGAQTMTAKQFIDLPVPGRGRPWNLVDGEVVVNEPTPLHAGVQGELLYALMVWTRAAPGRGQVLLPVDVTLDDANVFAPDVLWYADGRGPGRSDHRPSPMPDVAGEVRSPSTWRYDLGAKRSAYERHGLPELWLIDTAADAILVYRRSAPDGPTFDVALELGSGDALESPLLPGFALPLADLFGERD